MREPYIGRVVTRRNMGRRDDMVPVAIVVDHIAKLRALGMSVSMIARGAGVSDQLLWLIIQQKQATTRRRYAEAVLSVDGRPSKHQALVLAVGAQRRLRGLAVTGWQLDAVAERLGTNKSRARKIRDSTVVSWGLHVRVRDVFDSLGPDGGNKLTRMHALRQGWVHPLSWEDIDDPFEVPSEPEDSGLPDPVVVERLMAGRPTDATREERKAAFLQLRESGMSANAAADLARISFRTAERYSNLEKGAAA